MRRTYYVETPRRRKLKQETLFLLRKIRKGLDPGLLARIGEIAARDTAVPEASPVAPTEEGFIPVDSQKNMTTIMMFLEIKKKSGNLSPEMCKLIRNGLD